MTGLSMLNRTVGGVAFRSSVACWGAAWPPMPVPWVAEVVSRGRSHLARLMSLTVIGDLMSWMLARRLGVDPTPVETIEKLKKLLVEDQQR